MRFRLLLRPDLVDPFPVPRKLALTCLVHVQARNTTQACKCDHDAADLLIGLTRDASKHILNQCHCIVARASVCLSQFQRFFQKSVGALIAIRPYRRGEASFKPLLDSMLVGSDFYSHITLLVALSFVGHLIPFWVEGGPVWQIRRKKSPLDCRYC